MVHVVLVIVDVIAEHMVQLGESIWKIVMFEISAAEPLACLEIQQLEGPGPVGRFPGCQSIEAAETP